MLQERILEWVVASLLGAVAGAFGSFVWTRTRLALVEARMLAVEKAGSRLLRRLAQMDRRQIWMMELLADIAEASGVNKRGTQDILRRFLAETARNRDEDDDEAADDDDEDDLAGGAAQRTR
jgi:hypothetical protein